MDGVSVGRNICDDRSEVRAHAIDRITLLGSIDEYFFILTVTGALRISRRSIFLNMS